MVMAQRVLIVDDEPDIRMLCRIYFELEGYDVVEAVDGVQGLEKAKNSRPDAILLDVMMPKMNGWEVLAALKADEATAAIPVVMMTALRSDADRLRGWEGGVLEYVSKPFDPLELGDAVVKVIDMARPSREADRRRWVLEQLSQIAQSSK